MRRVLIATLFLFTSAAVTSVVLGQAPQTSGQKAAFDVAAIRENKSGDPGGKLGGPPGRFVATNVPVLQLIVFAYDALVFQIDGAPDWVKTTRFDINAKAEGGAPVPLPGGSDLRKAMMRSLLAERFKLVTHTESRQAPIYVMVPVTPGKPLGPQIQPSNTDCASVEGSSDRLFRSQGSAAPPLTADGNADCGIKWFPGRMGVRTQPMAQLAVTLSQALQRTVVDRTGLRGNYSATLTWTPDAGLQAGGGADAPTADPNAPSLLVAIQEQLGLKLESTRGPIDVLVIDHVEMPTPN